MGLWRQRVVIEHAINLVQDSPHRGRFPKALVAHIPNSTMQNFQPAATFWPTRTLAWHLRTNAALVPWVWTTHGKQPHCVWAFERRRDPHFKDNLGDVVDLYLRLSEYAVIHCVYEKVQTQAWISPSPAHP